MYSNPILHANATAKEEDLDRIEQKFHVKIPGEMREHYLAYNGGRPERTVFTDKNGDEYFVDLFIPVRERFKRPLEKRLELLRADDGVIPDWLIPFAEEGGGNLFCFSVRESNPAPSIITITNLNTARTRRSISPGWRSPSQRFSTP